MRIFGSDRISKVMDRLGIKEGEVITHSMVTKSIERAQKKIEAMNFSSRKNLIDYDDVMNNQREIVYNRRNFALHEDDISSELNQIISEFIEDSIGVFCSGDRSNWDLQSYQNEILNIFAINFNINDSINSSEKLKKESLKAINSVTDFKKENFNEELFNNFQKYVILRTIDEKWQDHLYTMDQIREGIGLRAYGQKNPLIEYKQEGYAMFEIMMEETNKETLKRIFRTDLTRIGQSNIQASKNTQNLKTSKNQNILSSLATPPQQTNQNITPPQMTSPTQNTVTPGMKRQPMQVEKKIGRNEPCPCGSGKKYKKCHGALK